MAHNAARIPVRNRPAQRKADENATSKHTRQNSSISAVVNASRFAHSVVNGIKAGHSRPALGEVTTIAVNRRDTAIKPTGKEKELPETGLKRARSASATGAQRIPLGPSRSHFPNAVRNIIGASQRARIPVASHRVQKAPPVVAPVVIIDEDEDELLDKPVEMDIEEEEQIGSTSEDSLIVGEQEVEAMVGMDEEELMEEVDDVQVPRPERQWPEVSTDRAQRIRREIDDIRETFQDEVDIYDVTMVSEYAEEIFEYMCDLEEEAMPTADYMDGQNEITWAMRQTLVDWLLQVHLRYHMLPETLWIAINLVDRFLSKRVVSLVKLQLVGVTAMFIAAKYEEILAPGVEEFVYMTENGYTKEEILKGERIVLQTLDFKVSHYCSPYSWMRKISKADDYDIQTRTLSKFLTEVTLLDQQFLRVKPSMVAAIGMYSARRMLGGDWGTAFVFFSGYTEEQLLPGHQMLMEKLLEENFSKLYVCKKYAHKKFLKASLFAIQWAGANACEGMQGMSLQD